MSSWDEATEASISEAAVQTLEEHGCGKDQALMIASRFEDGDPPGWVASLMAPVKQDVNEH